MRRLLQSIQFVKSSVFSRLLRTRWTYIMAERGISNKEATNINGSPPVAHGSVPSTEPEKDGRLDTVEESNVYKSKYGPNSMRKRHRQTSQSQTSELDNKRSLSALEEKNSKAGGLPMSSASSWPANCPVTTAAQNTATAWTSQTPAAAGTSKNPATGVTSQNTTTWTLQNLATAGTSQNTRARTSQKTAAGTSGNPIDLTDDPAVMAVGHVMNSQQASGVIVDSAIPSEQPERMTKEQMDRLVQEQAKYAKKVATLVNRPWEHTSIYPRVKHKQESTRTSVFFTVISYNVLAQNLLEDNLDMYDNTRREHLSWDYRSHNLLKELCTANADILCLQEVSGIHYESFFQPELAKIGYSSVFKQRTGDKQDGCATFFKTDKFELGQCVPVEYFKPNMPILDRDNVGLIVLLRTRLKQRSICIANTHLLFNPRRGDIKLAQLMVLFSEIDKLCLKESRHSASRSYHPVILCGDLNAEPHCDLYRLIAQGYLRYEGLLARIITGQQYYGGRDNYLTRQLVPPHLGISDQCQYVDVVQERNSRLVEDFITQQETRNAERPSELDLKASKVSEVKPNANQQAANHSEAASCSMETDDHSTDRRTVQSETSSTPGSFQQARGQPPPEDLYLATHSSGTLSHKLKLTSVYKHSVYVQQGHRSHLSREATTHHGRTNSTVDYIFYSVRKLRTYMKHGRVHTRDIEEGRLKLVGKVRLPTEQDMVQVGELPNELISSDHVMLMAKFLLKLR